MVNHHFSPPCERENISHLFQAFYVTSKSKLGFFSEERRKRFFQICATAAFCHRGMKLLDNFDSLSQVWLIMGPGVVLGGTLMPLLHIP